MRSLPHELDEIPVTLVVAIAYVTFAFLTDPWHPTIPQLVAWGAARGLDVVDGQSWRLLSHAFLHGGWWHVGMNLYALLVLGPLLERSVGSLRFLAIYLVSAVAGGVVAVLWNDPRVPLVGGSGALFGMQGAIVALLALGGSTPIEFLRGPGGRNFIGSIVVNLAIGLVIPFISNAAHLGGLVAGFAITYFALVRAAAGHQRSRAVGIAVLVVWLAALFAALKPVWRWDYLLVRWERAVPAERDALRRAFSLTFQGSENAIPPGEMPLVLAEFQKLRDERKG